MKYVLLIVGVFLAFVLGYLSEPNLRGSLIALGVTAPVGVAAVGEVTVEPGPQVERGPDVETEPGPNPEVNQQPIEGELNPASLTDEEIRQIMQNSIEGAEIQNFTINQVSEWKGFGEEEIDGVIHQYGLIDYKEETDSGGRTIEAKAVIRDRKVLRWIWTGTGLRIE